MPALTNARWELFAQGIAQGKTQDEAYVLAGYKRNRCNAGRLKTNEHIGFRVAELMAKAAVKTEITVESLQREAAEIQHAAFAAGQFNASSGALTLKAKLAGLLVEKTVNTNTNRNIDASRVTDEQLAEIIGVEDEQTGDAKPSELH